MNIINKPRNFYIFLVLTYGILIFLTIQILTFTLYKVFSNSFSENNEASSQQNLSLLSANIENLYAEAKATCQQIYIDKDVTKLRNGSMLEPLTVIAILDRLVSYSVASPELLSVYVYSLESDSIYDSHGKLLSTIDGFFDKGILEIIQKRERPDSSLIPRVIEKVDVNGKVTDRINVYSLMLTDVSRNPNIVSSAVVLNFKESWILKMFRGIEFDRSSEFMFINDQGVNVGGTIEGEFLKSIENEELMGEVSSRDSKSFQLDFNGGNYMISHRHSKVLNWDLVKFTPFDEVNSKVVMLRNLVLIINLAVLLISLIIMLFLSKKVHKPVVNVIEKMIELEKENSSTIRFLRNDFMRKFLTESIDFSVFTDGMDKYDISFEIGSPIKLIYLEIDDLKRFYDSYDSRDRKAIIDALKDRTVREIARDLRCEIVDFDKDRLVVIVNSTDEQEDEIVSAMAKIQENVHKAYGISFSCVIGKSVNYNDDIPAEMNNLMGLMNYRLISGYSSILMQNDITEETGTEEYVYPDKKEKQLFEKLMSGEHEAVMEIFGDMIGEAKAHSYNTLMVVINKMVLAINIFVEKLKAEYFVVCSFDFYSFNKTINNIDTLDGIIKGFDEAFSLMISSIAARTEDKNSILILNINEYIEKNFSDPDLSVNAIADKMDRAAAYINRIFRNASGRSIQHCIDDIRLKNSLRLLKETSMSIKEISDAIGITNEKYYYVLFKKYFGQTPNDYRTKIKQQLLQ